jgi:hypothetical protein
MEKVAVGGTVVSVNPMAGTFVANAFVISRSSEDQDGDEQGDLDDHGGCDQGGSDEQGSSGEQDGSGEHGSGGGGPGFGDGGGQFHGDWSHDAITGTPPATTQVTITTNSSTVFHIEDKENATISDLAAGDKFEALFNGSPTDPITTITSTPALAVFAEAPPKPHQLYAFVGTVTGTDTTKGTLTVTITRTLPSALAPAGSSATFTVSADTLVLGGSNAGGLVGGSLANVSMGDIVAGGLIGDPGETLAQVEMTPLRVLLDLPASSVGVTTTGMAKDNALKEALALLGDKSASSGKRSSHQKHGHKHHGSKHHHKR